jgi:hypothetical protein
MERKCKNLEFGRHLNKALTCLVHRIHTLLDYAQIELNIGHAASFLIKHEKKSGDWTY